MTRAAAILVAALSCLGCVRESDEKAVATYLVYTKAHGLPEETIWIGDVNGRGMKKLVRGTGPLVAPNGSRIAFHRCLSEECHLAEGPPSLYTVPPEGGEARLVAREAYADGWFPDSKHLLSVGGKLVKIDVESGKQTVIARPARQVHGWSISPDGAHVVYAVALKDDGWGLCDAAVDLFVADADGGAVRRLTTNGNSSDPIWSENGIAFARHPERRSCVNPAAGIWTMRPDGRRVRPVVPVSPKRFSWNGYYGLQPYAWVRGRSVLLGAVRSEWGDELALVNMPTGRIRKVDLDPRPRFTSPMYVDYPSDDGRHVLGAACGAEYPCTIQLYSVLEGRARNLITGRVGSPHWNR